MKCTILLLSAAILFALPIRAANDESAWDKTSDCFKLPKQEPIVGECFTIHGRADNWGSCGPMTCVTIWRVGTKRVLGISGDLPANAKKLAYSGYSTGTPGTPFINHVYGDFLICPLSHEKPGHMQFVCVAKASNLHLVVRH
jgi:hypothetical protein